MGRRRVGVLVPMRHELRPLAKIVELRDEAVGPRTVHRGQVAGAEIVATVTTMGTDAATATAEFVVRELDVDHVAVIGIAGGLGPDVHIGDLLVPEVVVDYDSRQETHPARLGGTAPAGKLMTSGELIVDYDVLRELAANGAAAIDMETSAIGAVCEREGLPWSVFRGISDHIRDGLVDGAVGGLAKADGSADIAALVRYLGRRPWRIRRLAKLGRDMNTAATVAARGLVRALEAQ